MTCSQCKSTLPLAGYRASFARNPEGKIVCCGSGWVCGHCMNLPAFSTKALFRWENKFLPKKKLPKKEKQKVDLEINKIKADLARFNGRERNETHKEFQLFCKKYFNGK